MELSTILTYLALLITAYGATQEYIRLKLKLASKMYLVLFSITLLILYVSTLEIIRLHLTYYGVIYFPNGYIRLLWEAKYLIVLTLNLFSLYMIIKASKLTVNNQKEFLNLIHELKGYKNIPILHKLIDENFKTIFKMKYTKTFEEKASSFRFKGIQELLKGNKKESTFLIKYKNKISLFILKKLSKFSFQKETINEIFQYAISDKLIIKSVAESNEPLGLSILKQIVKYKAFDSNFKNRFLITVFKNRDSYIYKEYIVGHSNSIHDYFSKNQEYKQGLDLGLNIAFAILELIEDNSEILIETYEEYQLKPIFKHIRKLLEALENTDPNKSHYSNLPHYIQKTILKHIDLSKNEETVGFYFLNQLFGAMKELNVKCNGCYIEPFNSLYSGFIGYSTNPTENNIISIGCHYIDYMFNDMYFKDIDTHVEQFKEHITKSWSSNKTKLLEMYLLVLDTRRDRGDCEDYIHYIHDGINTKISDYWDEIIKLLETELDKIQNKSERIF